MRAPFPARPPSVETVMLRTFAALCTLQVVLLGPFVHAQSAEVAPPSTVPGGSTAEDSEVWTFDVTSTGNNIHWVSPTSVETDALGYDSLVLLNTAEVTVRFLGFLFGPFDILDDLPQEILVIGNNSAGPLPLTIADVTVSAPPPPASVGVAVDLSSGLHTSGFGSIDFVNVVLATMDMDLGGFGTVTTDVVSVRLAGLVLVAGTQWVTLGGALAGLGGLLPELRGYGAIEGGDQFNLLLRDARPSASAALIFGLGPLNAPFKGGMLVPTPDIITAGLPVNGLGQIDLYMFWPTGLPSGVSVYFQYWITDAAGVFGFSASNGVRATTP